ncbi:OmpA family protein [Desulfovibrio sp. OttesenSCG-928-I05]|nr:OmpA family protein [Desulfovibrio sp. OttesenSCG-928-I05]
MARKKKKSGGGGASDAWMVTFSDLMTLLLTFFVLLLSMSSMDRTSLTIISASVSNISLLDHAGRGRVPDRIQMVMDAIEEPRSLLEKLDRIKDLLFPHDILPPELSHSTLEENLMVLSDAQGIVIVLTDELLFPKGQGELAPAGRKLLDAISPFLMYTTADVTISGHTDNAVPSGIDPYALSGLRALSVLEYFLQQKLRASRFSIGAYGADRPLVTGDTPQAQTKNRRVEILVKTSQYVGRYP